MSDTVHPAIVSALNEIGAAFGHQSGQVFYTGRSAFAGSAPLYLLGLNPGGDIDRQAGETVAADIRQFFARPAEWSAYADQRWAEKTPGTHGLQPRVLNMLAQLGLDPRRVPASNVVFVRSRDEKALDKQKPELLTACWPLHAAVISSLEVRVIACFGGTSGRWVRNQIGAHEQIDCFREDNHRKWESLAHRSPDGRIVATLTHPGRADWTNPVTDPTPLVARLLERMMLANTV